MVDKIDLCSNCQKESLMISETYFHAIEPTKDALICQIKKVCATCKECNDVYLLFDHLNDEWDPDIEKIEEFEKIIYAELRTLLHKNRICTKCSEFTPNTTCKTCGEKTDILPYVIISNIKKVFPSDEVLKK